MVKPDKKKKQKVAKEEKKKKKKEKHKRKRDEADDEAVDEARILNSSAAGVPLTKKQKFEDSLVVKLQPILDAYFKPINTKLDALLKTNPLACLEMKSPSLLTCHDGTQEAIQAGGQATWTVVKCNEGEKTRYFAIGSKHCAFYYETLTKDRCFVSLPERVVKANVLQVGLLGDQNSCEYQHDAVAVEMALCPRDVNPKDVTEYMINENTSSRYAFSVGMSESGPVVGKNVVKALNQDHYVFVEDQGEPDNIGTLMFVPDAMEAGGLQILGTYFGGNQRNGLIRPGGIVSPLPKSISKGFAYSSVFTGEENIQLIVRDKDGSRVCLAQRVQGGDTEDGFFYYTLEDGEKTWPGVLLEENFTYNGFLLTGSARSK